MSGKNTKDAKSKTGAATEASVSRRSVAEHKEESVAIKPLFQAGGTPTGSPEPSPRAALAKLQAALQALRNTGSFVLAKTSARFCESKTHMRRRKLSAIIQQMGLMPADVKPELGFVPEHLARVLEFSMANQIIEIYRPVNPKALSGLEAETTKGKTLGTKGKSTDFEPIAGFIPFQAVLSKLRDHHGVQKYQEKNITALKQHQPYIAEIESELRRRHESGTTIALREKICQAHELGLVEAVTVRAKYDNTKNPDLVTGVEITDADDDNNMLYFMATGSDSAEVTGEVIKEKFGDYSFDYIAEEQKVEHKEGEAKASEKPKPLFLIRRGTKQQPEWFAYNSTTKMRAPYDKKVENAIPVKLFAYRHWEMEGDEPTAAHYLVTSDYDMLGAAARKTFPFFLGEAGFQTVVKADMFSLLSSGRPLTREQRVAMIADCVLGYEVSVKQERRAKAYHKTMGIVDAADMTITAAHRVDTDWAINHGAEVDSPAPQPFEDKVHPTVTPDGYVGDLKSEKDVCEFINAQRKLGYPLYVNGRWGWVRNTDGDLQCDNVVWKNAWSAHQELMDGLGHQIVAVLHPKTGGSTMQKMEPLCTKIYDSSVAAFIKQQLEALSQEFSELWKAFLQDAANMKKLEQFKEVSATAFSVKKKQESIEDIESRKKQEKKLVKRGKTLASSFYTFCQNRIGIDEKKLKELQTSHTQLQELGGLVAGIIAVWLEPDVYYNYSDQEKELASLQQKGSGQQYDPLRQKLEFAKQAELCVRIQERLQRNTHIFKVLIPMLEKKIQAFDKFQKTQSMPMDFVFKRLMTDVQAQLEKENQQLTERLSKLEFSGVSSAPSSVSSSSLSSSSSSSASISMGAPLNVLSSSSSSFFSSGSLPPAYSTTAAESPPLSPSAK